VKAGSWRVSIICQKMSASDRLGLADHAIQSKISMAK
jgi:hypothetical protein